MLEREVTDEPPPALQQRVAELPVRSLRLAHPRRERGRGPGRAAASSTRAPTSPSRRARLDRQGSAEQGGRSVASTAQQFVEPFATGRDPAGRCGLRAGPHGVRFHIVLVTDEPPASRGAARARAGPPGRRGEDVDLNDRYGIWDRANGPVVPPDAAARRPRATTRRDGEPGRSSSSGSVPPAPTCCVPAARAALERARSASRARHAIRRCRSGGRGHRPRGVRRPLRARRDLDDCYRTIVDASSPRRGARRGRVRRTRQPGRRRAHRRAARATRPRAGAIELEVVPGLSFAELAWARLGVDPLTTGAHVVDGRALDAAASTGASRCSSPSATTRSSCPT